MIIDVHYHTGMRFPNENAARAFTRFILETCECTGYSKPFDEIYLQIHDMADDEEGDKLVKRMAQNGIDKTVVCIVDNFATGTPTENIMRLNELCAAMAKNHPGKLISLASIDPRRPEAPALLRHCLEEYKMSGLKWHPDHGYYPNSPEAYSVLKVLSDFGFPLLTHCSPLPGNKAKYTHPIHLDDIAADFPNIEIIAAHMGFLWWHEWAALAQFKKNISGDMAVWQCIGEGRPALFRRYLREIIDNIGPYQILWGTDGPFYEPVISNKRYIEIMQALTVRDASGIVFSQVEVDAMLGGNAARIFTESTAVKYIEYVDKANKFAFSYPKKWTKNIERIIAPIMAWFSSDPWNCPGVRISKWPDTGIATLSNLITEVVHKDDNPVISTTSQLTNDHGITAGEVVFKLTSRADGVILDAKAYGVKSRGFWWVMQIYQSPTLGTLDAIRPDEIFNTWKFIK